MSKGDASYDNFSFAWLHSADIKRCLEEKIFFHINQFKDKQHFFSYIFYRKQMLILSLFFDFPFLVKYKFLSYFEAQELSAS